MLPQIADLGRGSFGFVQKAKGRIVINGQPVDREVAIKFIPRGNKVRCTDVERASCRPFQCDYRLAIRYNTAHTNCLPIVIHQARWLMQGLAVSMQS